MKSLSDKNLPSSFAALRFVCGCFDVGLKELKLTREIICKHSKGADKYFPKALTRMMLIREATRKGKWHDVLKTIHRTALYDRMKRTNGKPLFSHTGEVADELISTMLNLYERLVPKLDSEGISQKEVMWLLVENVFVPMVFVKQVREWRLGLGTELQGDKCWYLPVMSDNGLVKPIPRILDCWLRVAGFRTAYGVSKTFSERKKADGPDEDSMYLRWEAWKKSVGRWLNGEGPPSAERLHKLVDEFASLVEWLDEPSAWKSRFTLACAMQKLSDEMDVYFKPVRDDSSLAIADIIRDITAEHILCDDEMILGGSHTFFATRLLQRRLQQEGEWEKVIGPIPTAMDGSFSSDDSDEDRRNKILSQMNPGNRFLKTIMDQATADGCFRGSAKTAKDYTVLEEYIFEMGIHELNRLLDAKRKGAGKP